MEKILIKTPPVLRPYDIQVMGGIPTVKERKSFNEFRRIVREKAKRVGYDVSVIPVEIFVYIACTVRKPISPLLCANSVLFALFDYKYTNIHHVDIKVLYTKKLGGGGIYIENRYDSDTIRSTLQKLGLI